MNSEKITITVDGITCSHCSGMVQRPLEEIDGIADVNVDLEGKKASFTVENDDLIDTATKEVTQAGYKASKN